MESPRISKPREPYFSRRPINNGISDLQGAHQVAQKFTRTTLPLYCWRLTSPSLRSLSETVGVSVGLLGGLSEGPPAGNLCAAQTMTASKAITPNVISMPFFILLTPYSENLFRKISLPDSQVSRF